MSRRLTRSQKPSRRSRSKASSDIAGAFGEGALKGAFFVSLFSLGEGLRHVDSVHVDSGGPVS